MAHLAEESSVKPHNRSIMEAGDFALFLNITYPLCNIGGNVRIWVVLNRGAINALLQNMNN